VFKENKTIKEIFQKSGESYFREKEIETIEKSIELKNIIIATGGGTPLNKKNVDLLNKSGKIIRLKCNKGELKKRLKNNNERPLFKKEQDIERLFYKRKSLYDFADYEIDTSGKTIKEIAELIIKDFKLKPKTSAILHKKLKIKTSAKEYPVFIGENISENISEYITKLKPENIIIITDPTVATLFLDKVKKGLGNSFNVKTIIIDEGEDNKNIESIIKIYELLLKGRINRNDILLALGGGIIGDITGFVASTFKRGIKFIQIPTTLLAQVDASIGGKTGVNHREGKNMIGSFYQPEMVIIDTFFLKTLPENTFISGVSEIIKYSIIKDVNLFTILENKRDDILKRKQKILSEIISRCVKIKGEIVEKDEKEVSGIREILNFGHTIGHIIESKTGYEKFSHGEAVAIGMIEESKIAVKKGILDKKDLGRIKELIHLYKLPNKPPEDISIKVFRKYLSQDKKVRNGKLKIPFPVKIGKTIIKGVSCKDYL
jgi:3-dehydroquinate synthase